MMAVVIDSKRLNVIGPRSGQKRKDKNRNELIARVRESDDQAAEDLIRRYEPDLRVIARID